MYENICDCVFVCLQCICATSVTMCLCVCVLWCWPLRWKPCGSQWDGQVSYKYVMNSKTFGRELLARPRVVGVFWHERQEAWKLPKTALNSFNGSVLEFFSFFRRKSWGLFRTAGLWNTCLQKSAMKLLSCHFEKLRQARLDEQHKKPTVFNVGLCLLCWPTFLNGCKISKTTNMNLWRAQVNHMTRYTSRLLIICWTVRLFWHQNYTTYTFQLGV